MADYKPPKRVRLRLTPPITFRNGDRVRVKALVMAGRVGTFFGIMDGLAVILFDNGQEMARRVREWDHAVLTGSLEDTETKAGTGLYMTDLSNIEKVKGGAA